MNGTESISKKVLPLAAVLILCAASLVTVAYAYNATYNDTVKEAGVDPTEQSKYIYITGNGLTYGENDIPATVEVTYTSATEFKNNEAVTTLTPSFYKITALGAPASLDDNGIATIKIGQLVVNNVNTGATTVTLAVTGLAPATLSEGKTSLFTDALGADCIKFKLGENDYANSFEFVDNKVTVDVYLVKEINLTPDASVFSHKNGTTEIDPLTINDLEDTLQTTLAVPGFTIDVAAIESHPDKTITGTMTSAEITSAKAAAANGGEVNVMVSNSQGASITMNGAAVSTLANAPAALTVEAVDTTVAGVSAVYDISFGNNHFGQGTITLSIPYTLKTGESADGVFSVAYIDENDAISTAYAATYKDGYLTFTTNHLSKYGVMAAPAGDAVLTMNGLGVYYKTLADAFSNASGETASTITLMKDASGNGIIAPQGKFANNALVVDFNGHKYTVDGETVGSTGTETNGFQLLKDNKIVFKNGTIDSAKAKILVQNYSDLTLQKMTLSMNKEGYNSAYTLSNNNGNVVIDSSTITANPAGGFAFDVCRYSSYKSVHVEVTGTSTINGNIEIFASGSDAKDGFGLKLTSGTLNGEIVMDSTAADVFENAPAKVSITKASGFEVTAPAGFHWDASGSLVKDA